MAYRNHCVTLSDRNYTGGAYTPIRELIAAGSHRVETWGNAREGFALYLTSAPDYDAGCSISSHSFSRRCDADAAARRSYGAAIRIYRGRNFP